MPPDWEATARPPTSGTSWRRVALRPAPLASTPCELGPTRRRLCARARVSSSWRRSSLPLPEKPDEMTTAAPAPLAAASRSTSATPSAGTATTTRSTGPSRSARLRTVGSPSIDVGLGVHHVHGAGVRRAADRVEHAVPEAARRPAYADHGDARRVQQRPERPGGGAPLPLVGRLDRLAGGVGAQLDLHLARDRPAGGAEPGRAEDAQHPVVVAEDLRLEAADPVAPTERGEVLQEQAAQAPAAVLVGDQERDLGGAGGEQLGGRQTGDPPTHERHQGRRRGVVRSEEVVDVEPTGLPAGGEEAQPQRVHGHRLVQPEHGVAVVLAQRSDHRDGPVGEQHVRGLRAPVPGSEGRSRLVGHVPKRARAGRDVPPPRGRAGSGARTRAPRPSCPSATRSAPFCRGIAKSAPPCVLTPLESCYLL